MAKLIIEGGRALKGQITVQGAKNAALPILAAAMLIPEPVRIGNCPRLTDVEHMAGLLRALGCRSPLLLPLMGIPFVLSAVSVMIQVGSYKLRHGKRVFKMAPLHHHFELLGVAEPRITALYMLLTGVCCALSIYIFTK